MEQEQKSKQKQKKKKKQDKKLEFEIGKVFGPEAAKEEDFELSLEMARFRAQHGQGGDRNPDKRGSGNGAVC